ncbi:restriction endonuclease [Desulfosporosinus shakirovi]|uniref:restriction endonuclease n=1 Tax=Desulfosporosinus shakirovi TaxID=2885154 RepID=UPI001E5221EB|nr:restriction endonuclease [Desulfosporosinus sp. SRJS8]MCB8818142.1 restriction endonuclease [Desulfosporosinus sp. SRJS8]
MKGIDSIFSFIGKLIQLIFCIGFAIGFSICLLYYVGLFIMFLSYYIFGIDIEQGTVLFWVLPLLVIGIYLAWAFGSDYLHKWRQLNIKCPHGVRGGKVKSLCPTCVKIREDESREQQRKADLNSKANDFRNREIERLARIKVQQEESIRALSPQEFEDVVSEMYRKLDYIVEQTPFVNDHGKDAIMYRNGKKVLLECKRYGSNNSIGRPQFQKLFAAMVEENAEKGIFVNTGIFTKTAYEYGKENNIELVDMNELLSLMKQAYPERSDGDNAMLICHQCGEKVSFSLSNNEFEKRCSKGHVVVNDISYQQISPTLLTSDNNCPRCGRRLRRIKGKRGYFWGCTGYPNCSYTHSA